jgi:hypothetical protein
VGVITRTAEQRELLAPLHRRAVELREERERLVYDHCLLAARYVTDGEDEQTEAALGEIEAELDRLARESRRLRAALAYLDPDGESIADLVEVLG